ncbi:redox-regulated ATPase YchF [Buchnera aphidicola]|uniref:redox-regulated ATPase YchF n=1 Tax=Buchnera aphidicola TaxID=9 RepID=UPI0031B6A62D
MGLKCGIVGLPNVGKSLFFNLITESEVASKNFPFCTIKPNIGYSIIFDQRVEDIFKIIPSKKKIFSYLEIYDIAGLVKGASQGEGLGNHFLDNIKKTDAIIHVVRCFVDEKITHIYGRIDPIKDIEIINIELLLADLSLCKNLLFQVKKKVLENKNFEEKIKKILKRCYSCLKSGIFLFLLKFTNFELNIISRYGFLTLKPTVYLLNISEDRKKNVCLKKVLSFIKKLKCFSIKIKLFLEKLENQKNLNNFKKKDLSFKKYNNSLKKIVRIGYKLLFLKTFFTVGIKEIKAWTIHIDATAKDAAHMIHSDIGKGFIRAEIISYQDFIKYKGKNGAKKFGKLRYEGKKYILKDGDIVNILFHI